MPQVPPLGMARISQMNALFGLAGGWVKWPEGSFSTVFFFSFWVAYTKAEKLKSKGMGKRKPNTADSR